MHARSIGRMAVPVLAVAALIVATSPVPAVAAPVSPSPPHLASVAVQCDAQGDYVSTRVVHARGLRGRAVASAHVSGSPSVSIAGRTVRRLSRSARTIVRVPLRPGVLRDCAAADGTQIEVRVSVRRAGRSSVTLRGVVSGASDTTIVIGSPGTPLTPGMDIAPAIDPLAVDAPPDATPPVAKPRAMATVRTVMGTVGAPVVEASGLAWSTANAGVLWTHNDSGDSARLFALGADGVVLATLPLAGASNIDWEDIALGPGATTGTQALYVADTGDNRSVRASVRVYRVDEPPLSHVPVGTTLAPTTWGSVVLTYPDGPRDAEALVVDNSRGDLYVITKREIRSRVYRADAPAFAGESAVLTYMGDLPYGGVVGADACADGQTILVKTYGAIRAHVAPGGIAAALASAPDDRLYVAEPQGESIAVNPTCDSYATLSEGAAQPLIRYSP